MKPIVFTSESVRAILDGHKTQTRRVMKSLAGFGPITELQRSQTPGYDWTFRDRRLLWNDISAQRLRECSPYGAPGDRLWVRETWGHRGSQLCPEQNVIIQYKADDTRRTIASDNATIDALNRQRPAKAGECPYARHEYLTAYWQRWRSPRFMPRWASRITLEILTMRVERLQDISGDDARAEGFDEPNVSPLSAFCDAWNKLNGKRCPWSSNPWVWVIEFKVCP